MSIAAVHGTSWYWYFGRATGLVALVLLTVIIVLGVLGPLRVSSEAWPRFAIRTVHRDISLLALLVTDHADSVRATRSVAVCSSR